MDWCCLLETNDNVYWRQMILSCILDFNNSIVLLHVCSNDLNNEVDNKMNKTFYKSVGGHCGRDRNYLCNLCLSPLMLVWILIMMRCTTLYDKVCQWLVTGLWFSPGSPVSNTNKTDCHDITEILLKVVLNTTKQTNIN
jgi:hypothetical protein